MMKKLLTLTAAGLLAFTGLASADCGMDHGKGKGMKHKADQGMALESRFTELDANSDQSLSWDEYQKVMPGAAKNGFDMLDEDKNGTLSLDEWKRLKGMHGPMKAHGKKYHDADLPDPKAYNAHFPDMDANGDEKVSLEEFKSHFPKSEESVFKSIDLDGDGGLDHDEWHKFKSAHNLEHME